MNDDDQHDRVKRNLIGGLTAGLAEKEAVDRERILRRVEAWAGSREAALEWYCEQEIPGFGRTARQLVQDGRAEAVHRYLERIRDGGFA